MKQYDSYKDSGLPWVGEIPSGWDVKRLKYAADFFYKGNGITKDEVFEDGDISCVRYGEIYSKYNGAFTNSVSKTKLKVQESPRHIKKVIYYLRVQVNWLRRLERI